MDIAAAKTDLRRRMRALRAALPVPPEAPARHLAGLVAPDATLAAYWPLTAEADPRPALHAHPGPCCLPQVAGPGLPLRFLRWQPGAALRPGTFGAMVPEDPTELRPEVLIVPLLAFDRRGMRLGYGGGYYDRTLAALGRPRAIGLAFAAQQVAQVPTEATDIPLDLIVTEAGVLVPA